MSALLAVLPTFIATTSNIEPATGLVIRTGEIEAAMGLRAMTITMVNKDTQPHTFDGYPPSESWTNTAKHSRSRSTPAPPRSPAASTHPPNPSPSSPAKPPPPR